MYLFVGCLICNLNYLRVDNFVMFIFLLSIYVLFCLGSIKELNLNNFVILFERENEKYFYEKLEDSD